MESKKLLVFSTLALSLFLFCGAATYELSRKTIPVVVGPKRGMTIGKPSAPLEIVLIEDFRCKKCRAFSEKIIPKIESVYVKPGKARLILIPISFLAGSQAISNAALEVYAQDPAKLLPFLKEISTLQGEIKKMDLVKMARRVGGIDLDRLIDCVEKGCHNQELGTNLDWARELMGLQFRTPALYINGAPGSTFSFEAIQYQIEQMEGKK